MRHLRPRCRTIPQEALEMISDVLLASSPQDDENPLFNEQQLARKSRRTWNAELQLAIETAEKRSFEISDEGVSPCGLKPRQQIIWEMYMDGYSPSEIADALGITRPTVLRRLRKAAAIVATTRSRLRGLGEVYRSEVHRKGYRKPDHCLEEPCRKLGYCRYAGLR